MSTTFPVDNVAPSTERFEVASVRNVVEQGRPQMSTDAPLPPRRQAPDGANPTRVHSVRADAQELVLPTSRFVGGAPHPLFEALSVAYDRHLPVSLSPDHIWTVILQGISHHINSDPEAHRDTLVSHRGKKTIVVALDDFVWGEDNRWEDAFPVFFKTLREDMGEQASAFIKPFSTTTEVASSVSHLLLMDSVKEFYSYVVLTRCGVPSVTLEGTPGDWVNLRERLGLLNRYGLEWWRHKLEPILDQFVAAAHGKPNRRFWRSMVKYDGGSGGPYYSGWIVYLFPYLNNESYGEEGLEAKMVRSPVFHQNIDFPANILQGLAQLANRSLVKVTSKDIPPAMHSVPFVWDYLGAQVDMEWHAGFVGVSQEPGMGTLRPELGWMTVGPTGVASAAG